METLSDKIRMRMLQFTNDGLPEKLKWLPAKDVKESIQKLKEKRIEHGDCAGYIIISEKKLKEIFGELANG